MRPFPILRSTISTLICNSWETESITAAAKNAAAVRLSKKPSIAGLFRQSETSGLAGGFDYSDVAGRTVSVPGA